MLTNEKLEEIGELAGKATYNPFDSEHERNLNDVCDSEIIEEMAKEILSLRAVLDGLPPEAIAGGWTAKGISTYAKKLELQLAELGKQELIAWKDEEESREQFEMWCTVNLERNKWHPDLYAHLPARMQWDAWRASRAEMLQSGNPIWIGIDWAKRCWPSSVIPDSFAIVPKVATDEMICAGLESTGATVNISDIWNSMIAVSPQPNEGE
ncbi:hypothetical protein H4F33_14620 [Pectobacterium brasiliense]|uniref:hypothetical protein n=1 Tax=Pectobacterium brasiliense TaxID=180957 RepID=UPI0015DED846|nr:hypothetical protein [Pectobacterium brasiliense]MBA0216774.1 hypothetical protein [Pectobacterium brasiliense]MBN3073314.1 hypothetical protein [Pectobacterium brasiliense]MBN3169154.1 hypothetical protein [Pectobacterium brasiliense]